MPAEHRGSCHCGGVGFVVSGQMRDVVICHCTQCRRWSGHVWAASRAAEFRLVQDETLVWFRSSAHAERGFCQRCGASLFWRETGKTSVAFSPAALDGATGLSTLRHDDCESAGDYYSPKGPPPAPSPAEGPLRGACLCGAARFTAPAPMGAVTACHCGQCRKLSGHYTASFEAEESALDWAGTETVCEYLTPGGGRRGFCSRCGSSLYFRSREGAFSVEAGIIANPTGGQLVEHIFTADKGDYYDLDDGLPQRTGW